MNPNIIYVAALALISVCIFLFMKLSRYKKALDEKNVLLIQFYLDTKFLCNALIDSQKASNASEFCSNLIKKIKDYYNLEELIILDSIDQASDDNNYFRKEVINYISSNKEDLLLGFEEKNLLVKNYSFKKGSYKLYITRIVDSDDSHGFIVCIERSPSLLSKQEVETMENCINLLKTRLIFG